MIRWDGCIHYRQETEHRRSCTLCGGELLWKEHRADSQETSAAPASEQTGHVPTLTFDGVHYDCAQCGRKQIALCEHWKALFERAHAAIELGRAPQAEQGEPIEARRERAKQWAKDYESRTGEGPGTMFYVRSYLAGYFNHPLSSAKPLEVAIVEQFEQFEATARALPTDALRASDSPDVQEAVIKKLGLVSGDALRELRELSEKATAGPWEHEKNDARIFADGFLLANTMGQSLRPVEEHEANADFIVACVNYVRSQLATLAADEQAGREGK